MTIYEYINENGLNDKLTELFRAGLVNYKPLLYRDMYSDFDVLLRQYTVNRYMDELRRRRIAVLEVAEKYKVSAETVYRAVRLMETKVEAA